MLAGCATSGNSVRPQLPALPAQVQEPCVIPAVVDQADARVVIARDGAALKACEAKRAGAVAYYDDLRKGLAGK